METTLTPLGASRAYQSARRLTVADAPAVHFTEAPSRPSFAELLGETTRAQVQTIRAGEEAAIAGLRGQMPVQKVVEATLAMESAVKTTVALRDRVVEAYQEIMRMSV
ncbi:flagellar hook-basal body complex protein FliE [Falsigemmobacter faecalis]|uniref:Flagellar hook-basal body complex protein FliE n=1 Tax=Falsigemmobacter faecalis TaxID=2488730 RepID=A0A3P3DNI4_9RHOB|nr:flagellar hook-basal body complex protein FliE [Falsigemmobacter faecalis]RRH75800.1 hypothetical protein EG244_07685 [Falsigemmobacter faecalis]